MPNVINNLRVNNQEVKRILFNNKTLKEFYYNGILVWKNANPFFFTNNIPSTTLASDTIIFKGFSNQEFTGSYVIAKEGEVPTNRGQIVVFDTIEGDK